MGLLDFLRGGTEQDRFAKYVIARLHLRGWVGAPEYDRGRFALVLGGEAGIMFLHNIFRVWRELPHPRRNAELDKAIASVLETEPLESFEAVAPRLLPVVRNRTHLSNEHQRTRMKPMPMTARSAHSAGCSG